MNANASMLIIAALVAAPLVLTAPAAADVATEPTVVALDSETSVGGMPVACTGIGQTKLDPRWSSYPVRVELSDAQDKYVADGAITLRDAHGKTLLSVQCAGPWILLKPAPGAYTVEGWLPGVSAKPRSARFKPPAQGQMRVVLKFPDV